MDQEYRAEADPEGGAAGGWHPILFENLSFSFVKLTKNEESLALVLFKLSGSVPEILEKEKGLMKTFINRMYNLSATI